MSDIKKRERLNISSLTNYKILKELLKRVSSNNFHEDGHHFCDLEHMPDILANANILKLAPISGTKFKVLNRGKQKFDGYPASCYYLRGIFGIYNPKQGFYEYNNIPFPYVYFFGFSPNWGDMYPWGYHYGEITLSFDRKNDQYFIREFKILRIRSLTDLIRRYPDPERFIDIFIDQIFAWKNYCKVCRKNKLYQLIEGLDQAEKLY